MCALKRLIETNRTSADFSPMVEAFINACTTALGKQLHSIYICGSIPQGTAVPGPSDADFTLVIDTKGPKPVPESIRPLVDDIRDIVHAAFPLLSKIDVTVCSLCQVINPPYDWAFWIAVISTCIYGEDLAAKLPAALPLRDMCLALDSDSEEVIHRQLNRLGSFSAAAGDGADELDNTNGETAERLLRKTARRFLIALYSLSLHKSPIWPAETKDMAKILSELYPDNVELFERLLLLCEGTTGDVDKLLDLKDQAFELLHRLRGLAADIKANQSIEYLRPGAGKQPGGRPAVVHYQRLRLTLGIVAFVFPLLLMLFSNGDLLPSISNYYWSNSGAVFIGALTAIGFFLITYNGYDSTDNIITNIAGAAIIVVAMCPVDVGSRHYLLYFLAPEVMQVVHFTAAIITFTLMGIMSLTQFSKSCNKKRNRIYRGLGIAILVTLASTIPVIIYLPNNILFFWQEVCVVWLFAASWIIKGIDYRRPAHGQSIKP